MANIRERINKIDDVAKGVVRFVAHRHTQGADVIDEKTIPKSMMLSAEIVDTALTDAKSAGLLERYIGFHRAILYRKEDMLYIPVDHLNDERYVRIQPYDIKPIVDELGGL